MLAEFTREELAAGLDAVAEGVLTEGGFSIPPVDAFEVAHALGMTVAWDETQEGRARYVRLQDRRLSKPRATIFLRPDQRSERQQWAVAHEIGEHVAHRVFAVWGVDPRETLPNAREAVANAFASRLLLPTAWFVPDAREMQWDLLSLKMRYETASHELIARRMLECEPSVVITIFDRERITFRRSNLPGRTPPPSSSEMDCWSSVHQRGKPQNRIADNCRISGWPVHEESWKREILRTEVENDL
jgi:Zn-dependent peptidase ImmA (M78 family)